MTSDIVAFLTARYDEHQRAAQGAEARHRTTVAAALAGRTPDTGETPGRWLYDSGEHPEGDPFNGVWAGSGLVALFLMVDGFDYDTPVHIAMHDPASVLADIASKRAILAMHNSPTHTCPPYPCINCATLTALVRPFADHPDFDPAWTAVDG